MVFGAIIVYAPLTPLVGGSNKAKSLWKFHRISGYILLSLLYITPLTAIQSPWVVQHSSKGDRIAMVAGLALVFAGGASRISVSKLGVSRA
ncbi:hypothetical protein P7C70_g1614, partial [Phenoliferia sp. Uapishka_3]